jgi:pyruvate,water dikinase
LLAPLLGAQKSAVEEPAKLARRQEVRFERAHHRLQTLFGHNQLRLRVVKGLVHFTRRYLLLRENQRFWFDRLLYEMQRTFLWLGASFVEQGWLDAPADIAFLTWEEVRGLAEGTLIPDPEWVPRRRARRDEDAAVEPPVFLLGDEGVAEQPAGLRLQGLGISPGRARGRVRVVQSLAGGVRLEAGDILVARSVDPGWTPLFLIAGGVVLEMGSLLSHGAVVAREYGVPAVVNIEGATRRLKEGQEITVDGARGVVWVHP